MQPQLEPLHRGLTRLGRKRRLSRWGSACCILGTTWIWLLVGLFAMDLVFQTDIAQRVVLLSAGCAVLCWAFFRHAWPLLTIREREVDLALMVERQHGVENDLVAALQFASPRAVSWGSQRLQQMVVRQAAQLANQWDLFQLSPASKVARRFRLLIATIAIATVVTFLLPNHVNVFLRRLALGSRHYPARTVVDWVAVNGQIVLSDRAHTHPRTLRCPESERIEFSVRCSRHAPEMGELVVWEKQSGREQRIALKATPAQKNAQGREQLGRTFTAVVPAMSDSLQYQIFLGDAWTDPGLIEMIARPKVDLHIRVTPPDYAKHNAQQPQQGQRHATVLGGSVVTIEVRCTNNKQLAKVAATLRSQGSQSVHLCVPIDDGHNVWHLTGRQASELDGMDHELSYEIQVTDADGLHPDGILDGEIRIDHDELPQAVVWTKSEIVVADASPLIAYRVQDDFGIARMQIETLVERSEVSKDTDRDSNREPEVQSIDLPDTRLPALSDQLPLSGGTHIDLRLLKSPDGDLAVGDTVHVVMAVTDYRGTVPGKVSHSEPVTIRIANATDVLRTILETDKQTISTLNELIHDQIRPRPRDDGEDATRLQRQIMARTRQLVRGVLDVQLQRLRDNRMEGLPVFGDIRMTKEALSGLIQDQMTAMIRRLEATVNARSEQQLELDSFVQETTREIVRILTDERDRVHRRMKVAELAPQMRALISHENAVRDDTNDLADMPSEQRDAETLAVLNDQKNAHTLFDHLVSSLTTVASWDGIAATAATEALARLKQNSVQQLFDEAEVNLGSGQLSSAIDRQTDILDELSATLNEMESAQGLGSATQRPVLETVHRIRLEQEVLRGETEAANKNETDLADQLTDRQHRVRGQLESLKPSMLDQDEASQLLTPATQAASQAEQNLFQGNNTQAVVQQDRVIQNLKQIEQLLTNADMARLESGQDDLIDQIQQLEQLEKALGELGTQQADVVDNAKANPKAAAQVERVVANELDKQAEREPLPDSVQRQVENAAAQSRKALEALNKDPSPQQAAPQQAARQQAARQQAAVRAQSSLQQARAEAASQLSMARQRQRGPKTAQTGPQSPADLPGEEANAPGAQQPSPSSSSNGMAPTREGNRTTGDQGRVAGDGGTGGGGPNGGAPWFAELPTELRDAIRSRVRQRPPHGYAERLRRYFEASDD